MSVADKGQFVLVLITSLFMTGCVSGPPTGPGSLEPPVVTREDSFLYLAGYASEAFTPEEARFTAERYAREQAAASLRVEIRAEMEVVGDQLSSRLEQRALARVEELELVAETRGHYTDEIGRTLFEAHVLMRMPKPENRWRDLLDRLHAADNDTKSATLRERMEFLRVSVHELEGIYGVVRSSRGQTNIQMEISYRHEPSNMPERLRPEIETPPVFGGQRLDTPLRVSWNSVRPLPAGETVRIAVLDDSGDVSLAGDYRIGPDGVIDVNQEVVPAGTGMIIRYEFPDFPEIPEGFAGFPLRPARVFIVESVRPEAFPDIDSVIQESCRSIGCILAEDQSEADISVAVTVREPSLTRGEPLSIVHADVEMIITRDKHVAQAGTMIRSVGVSEADAYRALPSAAAAQLTELFREVLFNE